jgi:hypothetical protein
MSEEDKLKNILILVEQGRRKEASLEILLLEKTLVNKNLRIQLIDAAQSALDPIKENETLVRLCSEAIQISKDFNRFDLRAIFMGRKADFLESKINFLHYEQQNLKLSPGWLEFSIEQDRDRYNKVSTKIKKIDDEINSLLEEALRLAGGVRRKDIMARVLMSAADIDGARYLYKKSDILRGVLYTKLWLKFRFMRYPFFENTFLFSKEKKIELKAMLVSFRSKFLKSAEIFEELNNPMSGYVYFNLANSLTSAYRFIEAKKYINKASVSANKFDDNLLKKSIESLLKTIKSRNRDIPDYVHGETRWDSI